MINPYKDATHRFDGEYMIKDNMGLWFYIDINGDEWPAHSNDFDQIEKDAVSIDKSIDTMNKQL